MIDLVLYVYFGIGLALAVWLIWVVLEAGNKEESCGNARRSAEVIRAARTSANPRIRLQFAVIVFLLAFVVFALWPLVCALYWPRGKS